MARYCLVDPVRGPLVISLHATNGVRVGGRFTLRAGDGKEESWDVATGDAGSATHTMRTPTQGVLNHVLQWRLLCCALVPGSDSARIVVEVRQEGVACAMTKPAEWETTIPPCEGDQQRPIVASLAFVERPQVTPES